MNTPQQDLLYAFDGHDVDGVRAALVAGASVLTPVEGKLPIYWLLEQYERSDQLGDCLRLLLERGATLDDPVVIPVLLNDADAIRLAVAASPALLNHRTTLTSAFTSLADTAKAKDWLAKANTLMDEELASNEDYAALLRLATISLQQEANETVNGK